MTTGITRLFYNQLWVVTVGDPWGLWDRRRPRPKDSGDPRTKAAGVGTARVTTGSVPGSFRWTLQSALPAHLLAWEAATATAKETSPWVLDRFPH
jgi:hypothetical protein